MCRTASAESAIWLTVAQTLNASSATASSSATTCRMVSTKWPLALYWRMVISVEAGAVAAPTAPSSSENDREQVENKQHHRRDGRRRGQRFQRRDDQHPRPAVFQRCPT